MKKTEYQVFVECLLVLLFVVVYGTFALDIGTMTARDTLWRQHD